MPHMWRSIALLVAATMLADCSRSEIQLRSGAQIFANHCAACHGSTGEGDGPVGAIMNTNVPNLRTLAQRNDGTFPEDAVRAYVDGRTLPASHGDRQMPIWGDVFGWGGSGPDAEEFVEQHIDAVVGHVRAIQY